MIKEILSNIEEDKISSAAAECAYYVVLSFIPFLILLITLIQYTNVNPEELINIISNIVPSNMKDIVADIVREVYSKSIGTISISLLFTLYSADKGLFVFTRELHYIYNLKDNKGKSWIYLKMKSLIQTALFIIILAVSVVIMVLGKQITAQLSVTLITFFIMLVVYKFMSNSKDSFKNQIIGAVFVALSLNVVSFIFSRYLQIFRGFSITYGSLTVLILIMMWIYICFYIIFIGAEINKYYNSKNV